MHKKLWGITDILIKYTPKKKKRLFPQLLKYLYFRMYISQLIF